MAVTFESLRIPGAFLARPRLFADERGAFFESWRVDDYRDGAGSRTFRQDNISISKRHVVRGLHYQVGLGQGQMVTIVRGKVLDVLVDLRRGSPTFATALSFDLDESDPCQLFMPPGVAHGFCVLGPEAVLHYKCTETYDPTIERGVRWDDPRIAISWPVDVPILSERDAAYPLLSQIGEADLPVFRDPGR